jgi:rubrerythrin
MENFICRNCKYKFKASLQPAACPYCDKAAVEKERSAEEIVEDVEMMLE